MRIGCLASALLFAAFSVAAQPAKGPELSWENAVVHVPGAFFARKPRDVAVEKPLPVVLFIHGCAGIQAAERDWANLLKGEGFIVAMPDTVARYGYVSCDGETRTMLPRQMYRIDEPEFMLEQVRAAKWADTRNLFVMGHSEGAAILARKELPGVRGVILSATLCTTGLSIDRSVPLLAVDYEFDSWLPQWKGVHCGRLFGDRANAEQLTLPGVGHNTYTRAAQQAVISFLKRHLVQ